MVWYIRVFFCNHWSQYGVGLHAEGDIVDDVACRIRAEWLKWRGASRVLCDKRISLKLK